MLLQMQPKRHEVGFARVLLEKSGIYRLRLEVAEHLLDEGARMVDETGRTSVSGAKLLLTVQATRAVHIFESVIALCRIGRGVPASMLNRALLEEALDAHWVAANPDVAPGRADEHEKLVRLGERAMDARFGRPIEPLTEAEAGDFKALSELYDGFRLPWTRSTDKERRGLIKDSWDSAAARDIDFVYEVIQRQNNVLLHSSPTAYSLAMTPGRRHPNRVGPDERWREALAHGALGFYLVLRVLADEFAVDRSLAERLFELSGCLSNTYSDEELCDLAAGTKCPCGSDRDIDECHRS